MKDRVVKDLERYLEIVEFFDTPLKFFEIEEEELRAECDIRSSLISFEGKKSEETVKKLSESGFAEACLRDTKPMLEV